MVRRVIPPTLLALTVALLTLHSPLAAAQADSSQSPVAGAGFDAPPTTTPSPATFMQPAQSTQSTGTPLPGGGPPTSTIRVFSRETILDVLADDDKGNPVRGLTRNDFTILEDGHPQPIRGFAESVATLPPSPPALPPDTYTNAHTLPTNGPVQIFLVQRPVAASEARLNPIPPAMLDYLRTMPLGTMVAIFSYSPVTGLELVQGFTSNGNAAADAASRIKPVIDPPPGTGGASGVIFHIAAMEQIAAYVAGIRGRKNLIWITRGMPLDIDRDGGYGAGVRDLSIVHRLMDVYEIFTREEISIYPIDPGGVHDFGKTPGQQMRNLRAIDVADQTGGTYDNTNDIQGELTNIVNRSSDTYTMSFVPPRPAEDARSHSIKIVCTRPGVHLTYRSVYDDDHPRPPDGMLKADLAQGPMRLGALPATQIIFTLEVTPSGKPIDFTNVKITDKAHAGSAKDTAYNAVFRFDPTQIAFSETPDGKRTAKLEFDLGVFNGSAALGPVRSQLITLSVNAAQYDDFMRKPFEFTLPIPIPAGQQTLRAGLFDTVGNKSGTLQVPLTVPKR